MIIARTINIANNARTETNPGEWLQTEKQALTLKIPFREDPFSAINHEAVCARAQTSHQKCHRLPDELE